MVFMAHSCYVFLILPIPSRGFFYPVVSLCVTDTLLVWGGGERFWQLRNVNFTANLIYWLHAEWLAMDV